MKAEEQILELLAEVLRKQDQAQVNQDQLAAKQDQLAAKQDQLAAKQDQLAAKQDQMQGQLDVVTQTLQGHQQILRTLATEQRRHGQQLADMQEAVESIARMQRNQNRRLDRLENPSDFV